MVDFVKMLGRLKVRDSLDEYLDGFEEYAFRLGSEFNLNHDEITKELLMSIDKKLSQLSKDWKAAEPLQANYSNIPDGDYVCQIKEMALDEAKKTGRLQVVTAFEIMDGEYQGQIAKRFDGLVDKTNMGYFKGLCGIIGLDVPDDIELLPQVMDEFVANCGDLFDIKVVTKKGKEGNEYTNVYVNGLSEMVLGEETVDEQVEEVVEEEVVEEEVAEEEVAEEEVVEEEVVEEEQQIVAPIKRFTSKPVQSNVVKKAAQPVKATTAKPTAKPVAKPATKPTVAKVAPKAAATKTVVRTVRRAA